MLALICCDIFVCCFPEISLTSAVISRSLRELSSWTRRQGNVLMELHPPANRESLLLYPGSPDDNLLHYDAKSDSWIWYIVHWFQKMIHYDVYSTSSFKYKHDKAMLVSLFVSLCVMTLILPSVWMLSIQTLLIMCENNFQTSYYCLNNILVYLWECAGVHICDSLHVKVQYLMHLNTPVFKYLALSVNEMRHIVSQFQIPIRGICVT